MSVPAKPATSKSSNMLQIVLLMFTIYLGAMLFLAPHNNQTVTFEGKVLSTPQEYFAALQRCDFFTMEATAQQLDGDYNNALDAAVKAKQMSQADADADKVKGSIIVADAQYKAGVKVNDTGRIRLAYMGLQSNERKIGSSPAWNTPVPVSDPAFPSGVASGHQLFQKVVQDLGTRNKSDLIYGFIPGGYQVIDALVRMTGANPQFSYAFAAFLLAFVVRAAVYPLAQKQLMFSRQMSQLTPRVNDIKAKYKDDQTEMNKRVMDLYKEYGINPMAGCGPMLIQMPLFLTVYQCMLRYQFQFQKGYFLWINPATSAATHGFIAPNLGEQDYLLVIFYGITMLTSTLLTPVTDPTQVKQQRLMGVVMSVGVTVFMFLGIWPVVSGFVLYWTFMNILSTAQSLRAYRLPMPPLVKVNAPGGGVYPTSGSKSRWTKMMEEAQKFAEDKQQAGKKPQGGAAPSPIKGLNSNGKWNGASDGAKPTNGAGPKTQPKHKPKKRSDSARDSGEQSKPE